MAIFFYVVALEVKREILYPARCATRAPPRYPLPPHRTMIGAALTDAAINIGDGELRGWAISIATDIAFALGVLGLAGRRAPPELRAFLLTSRSSTTSASLPRSIAISSILRLQVRGSPRVRQFRRHRGAPS